MATSEETKQLILGARRIGVPIKLIAQLAGVHENTVRRVSAGGYGEKSLLENVTKAMTALQISKPDEWLKRSNVRQHFASIDRMIDPGTSPQEVVSALQQYLDSNADSSTSEAIVQSQEAVQAKYEEMSDDNGGEDTDDPDNEGLDG